MKRVSLCVYCRHRYPGIPMKCAAYPEGVPPQFRFGEAMHVEPAEGDHGIQFELAEDLSEVCRATATRMVESWKRQQEQKAAATTQEQEQTEQAGHPAGT